MAFGERLSAIKGKQEAVEQEKKEEAEKAAEAAGLEREAKRSELGVERDQVMAEFAQAEQTANEAGEAITQADAFVAEQGENLDMQVRLEIETLRLEAREAQQKFDELKTKLETLNTEIATLEGSSEEATPTEQEVSAEVPEEFVVVTKAELQAMTDKEFEAVVKRLEEVEEENAERSKKLDALKNKRKEFSERSFATDGLEEISKIDKEITALEKETTKTTSVSVSIGKKIYRGVLDEKDRREGVR